MMVLHMKKQSMLLTEFELISDRARMQVKEASAGALPTLGKTLLRLCSLQLSIYQRATQKAMP